MRRLPIISTSLLYEFLPSVLCTDVCDTPFPLASLIQDFRFYGSKSTTRGTTFDLSVPFISPAKKLRAKRTQGESGYEGWPQHYTVSESRGQYPEMGERHETRSNYPC